MHEFFELVNKTEKIAREKKVAVKKHEKAPKSGRETKLLPVKNLKNSASKTEKLIPMKKIEKSGCEKVK